MSPRSLQTGKVRPLVPFFVPGEDAVNESLLHYHVPNASSATHTSPVSLPVREWDHAEGVFRDAYRLVHDATPQEASPSPPRLLTPAGIRQARRRSPSRKPRTHISPEPEPHASSNPTPRKSASPRPPRPASTDCTLSCSPSSQFISSPISPSSPQPTKPPSAEATPLGSPKPQRFAGSSFEIASPPPSNLPLPAFRRASSPDIIHAPPIAPTPCKSGQAVDDVRQRECAALELRRILRI